MDITPQLPEGAKILKGYGDGGFVVNEDRIEGNIFIAPEYCELWQLGSAEEITPDDFSFLAKHKDNIDILLIGCGKDHKPLPEAIKRYVKSFDIVAEMMATGAACRTYNVLVSEGRKVAAVLIAV